VTSSASGNFTTLGIATAAQAAARAGTFGGIPVAAPDALIMYTYGGDANLDGKINVDDYGRIDFNINLGTAAGSTATSTTTGRSTSTTTASSTSTSGSRAHRSRPPRGRLERQGGARTTLLGAARARAGCLGGRIPRRRRKLRELLLPEE
jgi:hypothetical protein